MNALTRRRDSLRSGFHGWRVVVAGSTIWGFQSLIWSQGFGNLAVVLRDPNGFGWSKTFLSFAYSARSAESAIIDVPLGMALRRFNIAVVMRVGAVVQMVGFIALALTMNRAWFIGSILVITAGSTMCGFLTITAATVGWFERKRARALSYGSMGFAIGGFCGPLLVFGFNVLGWRWTMAMAGTALAMLIWALAGTLGVTRAQTGEPLDGVDPATSERLKRAEGVRDIHFTTRQALATKSFWMLALGHGSALLVVSSVQAHLQLYLTQDRNFSPTRAAVVAGFVPLFQFIGTASGGFLGDRFNKRLISGVAMLMHGGGLLALTFATNWILITVFVVLHGLAWGARGPQMSALRADYFGTTSFGPIMGVSSLIITVFSIAGPLLAGLLADQTGDYTLGFTIVSLATIVGLVFFVLATPPTLASHDLQDTSAFSS